MLLIVSMSYKGDTWYAILINEAFNEYILKSYCVHKGFIFVFL